MKDHKKHNPLATQHALDVARVGRSVACPLNGRSKTDFISWLKVTNHKFQFRLLYCDLTTCLSFILLLVAAMRFNAVVLNNRWFYALTMLLLMACCILFISLHLAQHREADLKIQAKTAVINWDKYRNFIGSWQDIFWAYIMAILLYGAAYIYHDPITSPVICSFFLLGAIALFAYGNRLLLRTIRAKENTQIYVIQATTQKR